MADQKKEVLLRIRIDEEAAQKKIVGFQKEINATKAAQKELEKAIKEAGSATDEQTAQQVALKAKLADLTRQQRVQTKAVENQQKADAAATGSINQLRAQLASLTAQWNDLSEEERENADIGGVIEKQTKATSDKLKELEGRVGDTRRNVGNYTQSILQAADGSGKLGQAIGLAKEAYSELKGLVSDARKALEDEVKAKIAAKEAALASAAAENAGAAATGAATTATNINKAAIIGNVGALKLLKFALAATGIGAVLLLLGGLISFLTRTQTGIDLVSRKTKGFSIVLGVIVDSLSAAGKATLDWFDGIEDFGDLITKVGGLIKDQLMNRLKAFLVLYDAFREGDLSKVGDAVIQFTTGITDATKKTREYAAQLNEVRKAGEDIEKENQRLRDAERALNIEREKANAQIEKYKLVAEDTTKTEAERAEAARKAYQLEEELRNKQLQLQREKVANIEAEQALTNNLTEDNDKLAEAQIELARIEKDSVGKSIELQNKLNQLRQEGAAKAREAAKKQLEAEAALLEIRTRSTLNSDEDLLQLRLQILKKKTEQELLQEKLTQAQIKVIKEKALADEEQMRADFREEQHRKELEEQDRLLKQKLALYEKSMNLQASRAEMELRKQRATGEISEQQYQDRLYTMKLIRMQNELLMMEQYIGKVPGMEEKVAAQRIAISDLIAEHEIKNFDRIAEKSKTEKEKERERLIKQLEDTEDFVATVGDIFAASLTQQGLDMQHFAQGVLVLLLDTIEKAVNAQIAASVASATAQSFAQGDSVSTFGATGAIRAAILAGLIKGAFQVFKAGIIKATESDSPNVFWSGGYTGDGGKYEPAGVVHKGEVVFSQEDVRRAGGVQAVEAIRLRGYADGGIVMPPMRSSIAPSTRSYFAGGSNLQIDYTKLAAAIAKQPAPIVRISDLKTGQGKAERTARIANQ